jgi:hypothetical protein
MQAACACRILWAFHPARLLHQPRRTMTDPIEQRAQQWLPAFLAIGMSAFVAAVVTLINTGMDAGFLLRWLRAWAIACPAAVAAAYVLRPLAWRAARAVARTAIRG